MKRAMKLGISGVVLVALFWLIVTFDNHYGTAPTWPPPPPKAYEAMPYDFCWIDFCHIIKKVPPKPETWSPWDCFGSDGRVCGVYLDCKRADWSSDSHNIPSCTNGHIKSSGSYFGRFCIGETLNPSAFGLRNEDYVVMTETGKCVPW